MCTKQCHSNNQDLLIRVQEIHCIHSKAQLEVRPLHQPHQPHVCFRSFTTLSSEYFSPFHQGTCSLSVQCRIFRFRRCTAPLFRLHFQADLLRQSPFVLNVCTYATKMYPILTQCKGLSPTLIYSFMS